MNRPTLRTADLERKLLAAIAEGIPLREYCRRSGLGRATVYDWMKDPDFAARMARARTIGFEALADEIIEIADDSRNDWLTRKDAKADTAPVRNPENVARARLRIETRMRILARWYPQGFGGMAGRMGGMGGIAGMRGGIGGAGQAGLIAGPDASAQPMDTTAIAVRLSSILATIAARDPAEDGWGGDAFGDGDGHGTIIEHGEDAA